MPVEFDIEYQGILRCGITRRSCGHNLVTDAPLSYGGRGETFSPTDLVAAAIGASMMTIVATIAQESGTDVSGTRVHVSQEADAAGIHSIAVRVIMPRGLPVSPDDRRRLEEGARDCPVRRSLHPDVAVSVDIGYAG